ncbi:hypothetical protein H4R18_001633 [Coemansia javaensis]|uniref:Uncharacterized protein n=1 Tax=Coemansia javaensis TaxID=2761396 RepID=A0A9W8LIX1_9FUNG|nr:hypothetical protein H4R18_001633 [Coemansia javaensis]
MFGLDRTPRKIRDMLVLLVGRVGPNISDISFLRAFFVRSAAERGVSFGTSLEGMVEALHSIVLATATCTLPGGAVVAG